MIRAAVCDDEKYMADAVKKMAADFFRAQNIETVIEVFLSGKELLKYEKTIAILFLDIQMKGTDGMETARILRRRGFKGYLIFITVLRETVFEAFEVQAYDYLVKPIEQSRFQKTMERVLASMQSAGEAKLDGRFFRCHRSFLINLQYLRSYKNQTAYMEGGKQIPVSRLRSKEFSGVILRYMKERRL